MPRTPRIPTPRGTRSDPLQRTRTALHLDLPAYTPQTQFYHTNNGISNGVLAVQSESAVLVKAIEVARRILGMGRSRIMMFEALMSVGRLARDQDVGPITSDLDGSQRDWMKTQIGNWLAGANMVIHIDDELEEYAMSRPFASPKDLFLKAELVTIAFKAQDDPESEAYMRSIFHLAVVICREALTLIRGRIIGLVFGSPPTVMTNSKPLQPVHRDELIRYARGREYLWDDVVMGGEVIPVFSAEEDDTSGPRTLERLVLQTFSPTEYLTLRALDISIIVTGSESCDAVLPIVKYVRESITKGIFPTLKTFVPGSPIPAFPIAYDGEPPAESIIRRRCLRL